MCKFCRPLAAIALASVARGAIAADSLFISEYVEGSSYNKAIELYNVSNTVVDLSTYTLEMYFNGNTSPGTVVTLSGSVNPGETFVVAHSSASFEILAVANQTNSASWYNGDDAVVLRNGTAIADVIGQIGFDPGSEWGSGTASTQDNTLRRGADICQGDTDAQDAFDPAQEWNGLATDTFSGLGQHSVSCGTTPPPFSGITLIHDVQGNGAASPLAGTQVTVEGIVTADFQGTSSLKGFHVQEEDGDADSDTTTSEGLFVYDGGTGSDVAVGDWVRVTGTVQEYYGLTELTGATVQVLGSGLALPASVDITVPLAATDTLESYEGMRIRLPQTLTVTENYDLGRYGEVWLSSGGRLMAPTNLALPGDDALAVQAANDLNRILVDDLSQAQNPDPVIYPVPGLSAFNPLRSGDTVKDVIGVLDFAHGNYRIQPTTTPSFVSANPRTPAPASTGGTLKVASFNVLNYFNGNGSGSGFPTSRGADTYEEFVRQRDKIVAAIIAIDADIIGLMELENDGYRPSSAIADLVDGLNDAAGANVYSYVDPKVKQIGTDEIAVGLIYRNDTVAPVGHAAILDSSVDARFNSDYNRPSLAQTFRELASNERLTVAVNHLKSKGSACDAIGDPDTGDGQGNCNLTRTSAARALVDWLATDPTTSNDPDFLIIGDFNAYAKEDPISAIRTAGYVDLVDQHIGSAGAYSYVYMGQSGYLDHALASGTLATQVSGVGEWHISADEPRVLDYNVEYKSAAQVISLYNADPYRASDHDPVVVGLTLR